MLIISDSASMTHALNTVEDPTLRRILAERAAQLIGDAAEDLGDAVRFVITEPDDTIEAIERGLGFSPLCNLVDGSEYPSPDYLPSWEWIKYHEGWFEAVFILTDDGFSHVLLTPDHPNVPAALRDVCRCGSEAAPSR